MTTQAQTADATPPTRIKEPAQPDMPSFRALCGIMFFDAFNDNGYRFLLMFYLGAVGGAMVETFRTASMVAYTLPFVLFSFIAGQFSDRFSKKGVIFYTRLWEIALLLVGAWALSKGWDWFSIGILFMMAMQSSFFSPSKYGILPEIMPEKRLSWANGWLNGLTFLAIILGTYFGGLAYSRFKEELYIPVLIMACCSTLGTVFSLSVKRLPAACPERRLSALPLAEVTANFREIRTTPGLYWAIVASVVWWMIGYMTQTAAIKVGQDDLGFTAEQTSRLYLYLALGIGIGSYIGGRISGQRIEVGLIPLGAVGMGIGGVMVYLAPGVAESLLTWMGSGGAGGKSLAIAHESAMGVALGTMGFFCGWYIIPLNAFIQHRSRAESRGGIIGTLNFFTFAGMTISAVFYQLMAGKFGLTGCEIFLAVGIWMFFGAAMVILVIPGAGLRLMLFLFANMIYKLKVTGRENVPEKGGALLVCNHMSFADGLLVVASLDRPVRCLLFDDIYQLPLVKPFAKISQAIPISSKMGPRELIKSLQAASEAIKQGDLVCIFAEGQISRTGQLLPFRTGLERIMKNVDAPIIPMHLDRLWGSMMSFSGKKFLFKMPKRIPWPVTVSFGAPMPSNSTAADVRKQVLVLSSDAWDHRKAEAPMLHREAFKMARQSPFRKGLYDLSNPNGVSWSRFGTSIVALARVLKEDWKGQEMVGICLPPSVAAAAINVAALLMGKVPVNLNYTASKDILDNIAKQCKLETVITSKAFMSKLPLELPGRVLYAEDLKERITGGIRFSSLMTALFQPMKSLERSAGSPAGRNVDELCTVIFSSGSTGDPKGVMLTHWNVFSNVEAVGQAFSFSPKDGMMGSLPFFHSFGFMATLFLPLVLGVRVIYHPNPLDAQVIGHLVEKHHATFLVATPTFLQSYTRRVESHQFGSLQVVLTGAEKLRENVARAFEDKFGLRPYEGYGCTECSPVVAVNTHSFRAPGFYQLGGKLGSIGHPIPGVTIRIADPDTLEPLPDGKPGMLLVKGPNVMKGYLGRPDLTEKAIVNGWYVTGDMAKIDEDGFVVITDRLSRFSKIGGEMVPHIRVEEALHVALGIVDQSFAVAGIPDEKKGEKLVILHTLDEARAKEALEKIAKSGELPNLWIPKASDFHKIAVIPILGTGKMDLRRIKEMAKEMDAAKGAAAV